MVSWLMARWFLSTYTLHMPDSTTTICIAYTGFGREQMVMDIANSHTTGTTKAPGFSSVAKTHWNWEPRALSITCDFSNISRYHGCRGMFFSCLLGVSQIDSTRHVLDSSAPTLWCLERSVTLWLHGWLLSLIADKPLHILGLKCNVVWDPWGFCSSCFLGYA